ncbi:unnamed protein product [Trifolium pratense]|uniref:Uncharacterized protein n=1 Tax=Trifolium pratense TaxID=57577 RepID=A0ACB0L9T6_TRIPR|nr:unnamed protein product [Trifolium pratense]
MKKPAKSFTSNWNEQIFSIYCNGFQISFQRHYLYQAMPPIKPLSDSKIVQDLTNAQLFWPKANPNLFSLKRHSLQPLPYSSIPNPIKANGGHRSLSFFVVVG